MLCGCSPSYNDANFFSLLYIIQRTSLYIMWATPIFDWKLVDIYTDGNVNKGSESIELLGSYTHSDTAALQSIIFAAVCCSRAAAAAATHILCIERAGDESIRQIDMCVNAGSAAIQLLLFLLLVHKPNVNHKCCVIFRIRSPPLTQPSSHRFSFYVYMCLVGFTLRLGRRGCTILSPLQNVTHFIPGAVSRERERPSIYISFFSVLFIVVYLFLYLFVVFIICCAR